MVKFLNNLERNPEVCGHHDFLRPLRLQRVCRILGSRVKKNVGVQKGLNAHKSSPASADSPIPACTFSTPEPVPVFADDPSPRRTCHPERMKRFASELPAPIRSRWSSVWRLPRGPRDRYRPQCSTL